MRCLAVEISEGPSRSDLSLTLLEGLELLAKRRIQATTLFKVWKDEKRFHRVVRNCFCDGTSCGSGRMDRH